MSEFTSPIALCSFSFFTLYLYRYRLTYSIIWNKVSCHKEISWYLNLLIMSRSIDVDLVLSFSAVMYLLINPLKNMKSNDIPL